MAAVSRSSLVNFFVYNTDYGWKEGTEDEKIMLYIPQEENEDVKIKRVGLCEALVQFSKTFNPSKPCECLHTQKTKQFFLNPEGNYWIVLTISVPSTEKLVKDKKVHDYLPEDVQEPVVETVLLQAYKMFVLFNGVFEYIVQKYSLKAFKERLEFFYTRYLQTLNFGQLDILDIYQGISYLPLDKSTFLKVQCFSNLIDTTFKSVKQSCFLYDDQLLWTTLEDKDMRILYKYLSTSLFPTSHEAELSDKSTPSKSSSKSSSGSPSTSSLVNAVSSNPGRFLTAPAEMATGSYNMPKRSPRVFVDVENDTHELHLIVYKAFNAVVCLMLELTALSRELCIKLHNFIGPQLGNLSNILTEQVAKRQPVTSDQQYRFIYFNDMNLAIKSSIHAKRSSQISVSTEIMRLLVDIHGDFDLLKQGGEIAAKNSAECWIVGKRSGNREFFVILNQKNLSLIEINDEVKRLMATSFSNILFLE